MCMYVGLVITQSRADSDHMPGRGDLTTHGRRSTLRPNRPLLSMLMFVGQDIASVGVYVYLYTPMYKHIICISMYTYIFIYIYI